jgi:hypothetical protein
MDLFSNMAGQIKLGFKLQPHLARAIDDFFFKRQTAAPDDVPHPFVARFDVKVKSIDTLCEGMAD